jgi:3-hydroxyisobutyrate dehydrogenase-like beta-hydroxyacid dehydrogenase
MARDSKSHTGDKPSVGLIGLGLLGSAIAERLLRAGYSVVGFDISPPQREALGKSGGCVAESAGGVAGQCKTLLLSLPDSVVVEHVLDEVLPVLRAGHLVVDTTTGDPWQSASVGSRLASRNVGFLEATVAGSSAQVRDDQAIVMAGGLAEAFESSRDLLGAFAKEVIHVGGWGAGTRMKLVVNLALGLNRAVLAEALTLAKALEVDPHTALTVLRKSPAYSTVMDTKGRKMLAGDFTPQARLSQHLKDVRLMLAAAERTGVTLPLSLLHRALLEQVEAAGHGELDNSAILLAFDDEKTPPKTSP